MCIGAAATAIALTRNFAPEASCNSGNFSCCPSGSVTLAVAAFESSCLACHSLVSAQMMTVRCHDRQQAFEYATNAAGDWCCWKCPVNLSACTGWDSCISLVSWPFAEASSIQPSSMVQFRGATDPETLQREIARLENAISHLHRSIQELETAMQDDSDPELPASIQV